MGIFLYSSFFFFFFFNDTATTEIYTLSLHDALPISGGEDAEGAGEAARWLLGLFLGGDRLRARSEEHTSELQSRENLVCRLLLEKKKKKKKNKNSTKYNKSAHKDRSTIDKRITIQHV